MKKELLKGKTIYVVATGCNKSKEVTKFIKELEDLGSKVYLFATNECMKIAGNNGEFEAVNFRKENNVEKRNEIEKEDLILIAPCSFNTLNKLANGIADSYPLTLVQTAMGRKTPIIIGASMNINLWNNFNAQNSIDILSKQDNVTLIWPEFIAGEAKEEIRLTMASWNKIKDTILNTFHILPFNAVCEKEENMYNNLENKLFKDLRLYGKSCKEIHVCPSCAGCIAERTQEGILISATGADLGNLQPSDMVLIKKYVNDDIHYEGVKKPSSESILAWNLLSNREVGTKLIHCHCSKITYSTKFKNNSTEDYFLSTNSEQVKEVKNILDKEEFATLKLHGQVFIGKSFESIIGKIVSKYCECFDDFNINNQ